jgi:hypothetical protein
VAKLDPIRGAVLLRARCANYCRLALAGTRALLR